VYNSKTPVSVWQQAQPFKLGDRPLEISTECTHLGILRSTEKNQARLISERIQLARRTTYGLMGAGLHGNNGVNPLLSAKMLTTFVMPRYMHSLETVTIKTTDMASLGMYHKRVLKKIQHLPDRTADEAVFLLIGQLPIEGALDKRRLTTFGAIAKGDCIEKDIARRQLAVKDNKSSSWFIKVNADLSKYGLPDAHTLLNEPPKKTTWKTNVDKAVDAYWFTKLKDGAKAKSSLKYVNWDHGDHLRPHHVWSTVHLNVKDVQRAAVKARLLTGTYTLQEKKAVYYPGTEATCLLCKNTPETLEHFLLQCETLQATRQHHLQQVQSAVEEAYSEMAWREVQNNNMLLQLILDCTYEGTQPSPPCKDGLDSIESATRRLCFALHRMRETVIGA
jgi:hypothetical protein